MDAAQELQRVETYVGRMPALPVTVTKVIEICNQPDTSPIDLNRVISVDPVLMARVMKLINSAYYGLEAKVTSLSRAIIMLGVNTVKNLALSTAVVGAIGKSEISSALNMQGFWRHSLGAGVTAKLIARRRGIDPRLIEEYFIAGLLHDIGKIPLNNALKERYVNVLGVADREHIGLAAAEQRELGFTHADVGRLIGETWNIGTAAIDTLGFHHAVANYAEEHRDLVMTVHIANYFMNIAEVGFAGDRFPARPEEGTYRALGIDLSLLDDIEDEVDAEISKAEIFLKIVE
ncbi:MAG: HDOD domain-containing protein [Spirochaetaceae bacterium]|nr:MAG: HDOD domain-containing protein [Spirochaetaceae bacterium]